MSTQYPSAAQIIIQLNNLAACIMQIERKDASTITSRVARSLTAKLVAGGTGAGVMGVVATFGTASTGTAIATLSGAAATNATMFAIGSVVGGGVLAGTIATGGIGLAAGIVAMRLMKSKRRQYESLTGIDKQIVDSCGLMVEAIGQTGAGEIQLSDADRKVLFLQGLKPLYTQLVTHRDDINSRLDKRHRKELNTNVIPAFDVLSRSFSDREAC